MVSKQQRAFAQQASRLFKLAASPTRALILSTLAQKSKVPVGDIAEALGMTHSAVSHQLGLLSRSKIVVFEKHGRSVYYSMAKTPEAKALGKFLASLR